MLCLTDEHKVDIIYSLRENGKYRKIHKLQTSLRSIKKLENQKNTNHF